VRRIILQGEIEQKYTERQKYFSVLSSARLKIFIYKFFSIAVQ